MKIIFDVDGTLTDFRGFVEKHAIPYFQKKYGMHVCQKNALEIEDILQMDQYFAKKFHCSKDEAHQKTQRTLNRFWKGIPYLKYTLFWPLRSGAREIFASIKDMGIEVEIHTSRAKTTEKSLVGMVARILTYVQLWRNGIYLPKRKVFFYAEDEEKLLEICRRSPVCVFEDKSKVINMLKENEISVFCISDVYNTDVEGSEQCFCIPEYNRRNIEEKIREFFGKREFEYYQRAMKSQFFFQKLTFLRPFILAFFHPVILHSENILKEQKKVLYVSNHRKTLDPLVITAYLKINIHWAALKRFFDAEDSIFNNNKNPLLCRLTAWLFRRLEYFPIERKKENENANNFKSIKDMCYFLKVEENIGIFPEGTTRRVADREFGDFEESFLLLAKKSGAWIQPVTILWTTELKLRNKVILNFGQPFHVEKTDNLEQSMKFFMEIQEKNMKENIRKREELKKSI